MQEKIDLFLPGKAETDIHAPTMAAMVVSREAWGKWRMEPLAGGIGLTQSAGTPPCCRPPSVVGAPTLVMRRPRGRVPQILLSDEVRCAQLSSFRASECVVVAALVCRPPLKQ